MTDVSKTIAELEGIADYFFDIYAKDRNKEAERRMLTVDRAVNIIRSQRTALNEIADIVKKVDK